MATTGSSANAEVEQMLKKAAKLLHSTHPDSAIELRVMLDELIKQRYGPEKMICNTLSKRHLDAEMNFPGMVPIPPPPPQEQQQQPAATQIRDADEVINLINSPVKTISDSPDTIMDSDDGLSGAGVGTGGEGAESGLLTGGDDDGNLKDFGDLNCCVCGEMMFTATNRLIECSKCGALYHQECHKPPITDEEASEGQEHNWQCDTCCNRPSTSKAAGIVMTPEEPISLVAKSKSSATSSRSSSSSNSSSPFYKQEQTSTSNATNSINATPSSSKHHQHKTSTKSHKEERGGGSSSKISGSSSALAPIVNVASGAEKSTHSSSSSNKKQMHSHSSVKAFTKSSKHHENISSKRKSK